MAGSSLMESITTASESAETGNQGHNPKGEHDTRQFDIRHMLVAGL